jgi:hypothetical protein
MLDKLKADLWKSDYLEEKPARMWTEAVVRWIAESQHKRSLDDCKLHLRWLSPYLKNSTLNHINRDVIDRLANQKLQEGVKPSSVNRMLEVVRAILRKAQMEWEWIDRAPLVRMLQEDSKRIAKG